MDSANAASAVSPNKQPSSSLTKRIISGVVALPLIVGAAWWGIWAVALVVAGASIICLAELYGALKHAGYTPRFTVGIGAALLLCGASLGYALDTPTIDLTSAALGAIVLLSLVYELWHSRHPDDKQLLNWALTVVAACYVGGLLRYYILLRSLETPLGPGWLSVLPLSPGTAWVFLVLAITWGQDTTAYFVGRSFGHHKMSPILSPKKTWEGAVGGFLASVLLALAAVPLFGLPIGYPAAALLGIAGGIAGPLGDLSESFIKRQIGRKDMSNIMPGHGGLLDRSDSMLFTAPVLYYLILLVAT